MSGRGYGYGLFFLAGGVALSGCGVDLVWVQAGWPDDQRVLLSFYDQSGIPLSEPDPHFANESDPTIANLDLSSGKVTIAAQRFEPKVTEGIDSCGVAFTDLYGAIGVPLDEWHAELSAGESSAKFEPAMPESHELGYAGCRPALTLCDSYTRRALSLSAIPNLNFEHVDRVDQTRFAISAEPDDDTEFFIFLIDIDGTVLGQVELPAWIDVVVVADGVILTAMQNGSVGWVRMDGNDLSVVATRALFPSRAKLARRKDGLLLAYSPDADSVYELTATSTETALREDFPQKMSHLEMEDSGWMAASFDAAPPSLLDPQLGAFRPIELGFATGEVDMAFSDSGLYLVSGADLALLPRTQFSAATPVWRILDNPKSDPPVELRSVVAFKGGALSGGNQNSIFYLDSEGGVCAISRDPAIDLAIGDFVVLDEDHALGVTSSLAGLGTLSSQILFIDPN